MRKKERQLELIRWKKVRLIKGNTSGFLMLHVTSKINDRRLGSNDMP